VDGAFSGLGSEGDLKKRFAIYHVTLILMVDVKVKVKQSRYSPGVAQRVPGS
jgi:hypothetical protein